jgi:hypothetical protein
MSTWKIKPSSSLLNSVSAAVEFYFYLLVAGHAVGENSINFLISSLVPFFFCRSMLRMQAGQAAAAHPAAAQAAIPIADIRGGPHGAALLSRTVRLPTCVRQPAPQVRTHSMPASIAKAAHNGRERKSAGLRARLPVSASPPSCSIHELTDESLHLLCVIAPAQGTSWR